MPRFPLILVLMPCLNSYADENFSEEGSTSATRFDVLLGPSFSDRSITITDKDSSQDAAKFTTDGIELLPSISIRTKPEYIWDDKNWSYTFSANFVSSKLDKQVQTEGSAFSNLNNLGTEIEGLSIYLTPILYYQFARETPDTWQYRAGVGMGIGYQDHEGSFVVSNSDHANFGQTETVNYSGVSLSAGIYLEASYKRHHIMFNGDLIATSPSNSEYQYLENNISLKYQYRVHSFMLGF